MKQKYYKITGLNEGHPIEPFGVTRDNLDAVLNVYGDKCRYYEEIDKDEYELMLAEELLAFDLAQSPDPQSIIDVMKLLVSKKWAFTVYNASQVGEEEPIIQVIPQELRNQDVLLILVTIGNQEYLVAENNLDELTDLFREIEAFC
jgi:hypothetical protein